VGREVFGQVFWAGGGLGREGGEMSEVGSFAEGSLHWEGEVLGGGEAVAEPIVFAGIKNAGEIEEEGFGRGEFEVGREAFDEGEYFVAGGDLGVFIGFEHEEVGTTGERAGGAESGKKSMTPGCFVDFEERGFFAFTL